MFWYMRLRKLVSECDDDFNDHMNQATTADIPKMEAKRGLHDGVTTNSSETVHESFNGWNKQQYHEKLKPLEIILQFCW